MKILMIHLDNNINKCPPAINVMENLLEHGHEVFLISYNIDELNNEILSSKNFRYYDIGKRQDPKNNIKKYYLRLEVRNRVRKFVSAHIKQYDFVWTTSDITVREVGPILLQTKHVMELMELAQNVPMFGGHEQIRFDIAKYARHAYKVVVPEINRAYINKVWWGLDKLPTVLPNKPYRVEVPNASVEAQQIINILKNEKRKILLYQGGFTEDRKFDVFAQAIELLGDDYCLYFMGKDNNYRKDICKKYPFIKYVGCLNPPEHLLIAKYAYIGILTYVPIKVGFYSELNALYCAPNKTYEYALCNLPMIGTDVLGLREIFDKFGVGVCINEPTPQGVVEAVKYVSEHYNTMKVNCKKYYDSVDLDKIVENILN